MLKETSLLNIIHCNSHTRQFCLYESEVTVLVAQSCLTVCDSMDYGLPDSFVHGDSPLSMGFSRQEDCSGLPFPSPELCIALSISNHSTWVSDLIPSCQLRGSPVVSKHCHSPSIVTLFFFGLYWTISYSPKRRNKNLLPNYVYFLYRPLYALSFLSLLLNALL